MRKQVCVAARIRPSEQSALCTAGDRAVRVQQPHGERVFPLDAVLGETATQEDVFEIARPFVDGVAEGVDATLMCYGQTSAGKTHTMGLLDGRCGDGIVLSSLEHLFHKVGSRGRIRLSFLQLHKDRAMDLLRPESKPLPIREIPGGDKSAAVLVEGLTQVPVASVGEAVEVTKLAARQRVDGVRRGGASCDSTLSSRAHLIIMVFVVGEERDPRAALAEGTLTRLLLVDLAGSERMGTYQTSPVVDERLQESKAINASLSALGKVIMALSSGKAHVPYRDSTLTRVLQDGVGRGSSVCLIACVHAGHEFLHESIATLQFAQRCRKIEPCDSGSTACTEPWRALDKFPSAPRLYDALARFAVGCCAAAEPDKALQELSDVVDEFAARARMEHEAPVAQVAAVRPIQFEPSRDGIAVELAVSKAKNTSQSCLSTAASSSGRVEERAACLEGRAGWTPTRSVQPVLHTVVHTAQPPLAFVSGVHITRRSSATGAQLLL
jgi:hypothetical protein